MAGSYNERLIDTVKLSQDLKRTPYDLEVIVGWKIHRGHVTNRRRSIKAWAPHIELMPITFLAGRSLLDVQHEMQLPEL
eukprot:12937990-Prorocentrum_lima.AAC.1